jgi:O-antigen biosynthesis protein
MQILVLGMHRSGTSMVARLLNMLGVYFAPEGISTGANEQNPKGFWERRDVRGLNDMLLRSAKADWHLLSDFSVAKIPEPMLAQFKKEAAKIILAMDGNRPWFLKEPRLCVLAPLWLELLEFPICVFVYRSPVEVAKSLETRNQFPLSFGFALWEHYNIEALNATHGRVRIQVNHSDLMSDPVRAVRELAKELEANGVRGLRSPSENEVRAFIDPSLYRAKAPDDPDAAQLTATQKKLRDAFETGELMRVSKSFALPASARNVLRTHEQKIANETKMMELEGSVATLSSELSAVRAELADREKLLKKARDDAARNQAVSAQIRESFREAAMSMRQSLKTEIELDRLRGDLDQKAKNLGNAEIELGRRAEEIVRLKEQAKAASARQTNLNQLVARRDAALAEERAKVQTLSEKNQVLKNGLNTIEEYFQKLRQAWSFRFAIYTARRLGLVSREPRRWVEAIKNQFPATRKALSQIKEPARPGKETAPSPDAKPPLEDEAAATQSQTRALALRAVASAKNAVTLPTIISAITGSVCFIILHRLGAHHLRHLFNSFLRINTFSSAEFMIVLHACTDKSREVIESFREHLRINVIDCPDNKSFAYSNNRAAEQIKSDYLIFLNNDVIFNEDVVPEMLRCLQDPRIGLVGTRLLFPSDHPRYPRALQHGGIKFRPDPQHFFHRPFNLGITARISDTPHVPEKFPAVTAALTACRRQDFLRAGGFCEDYLYGYEDVDLGLSFRRLLGLHSLSANHLSCTHNESSTGKLDLSEAVQQRRANNIAHLVRRHGWYLRRKIGLDKIAGRSFFSEEPFTIAFAVTEAKPATTAGDFFTASELADACAKEFGWSVRYLERREDWYNLEGVDVLFVLLDAYDLSKVRGAKPDLVKVAWLRNWFERWTAAPHFDAYDLYLCSSAKSAQWLREHHRKQAWVFPLATSTDRFAEAKPEQALSSDYCFTGSYWNVEREIGAAVQPEKLDGFKFVVYGNGWETHPSLRSYARGFLPYEQMPKVYASTRVVVDDANHVTKDWGSVNSRVFDALAAGALVISNGEIGAAEVFDRELPTYRSPDELQCLLRRYLGDETERRRLTQRLRKHVLTHHTYRHRARSLKRILLARARGSYRIAFKIGAPTRSQIKHWGDFYFALSLGRALAAYGHSFRIDCIDEWARPESFGDDVVIVLRGLSRYQPKQGQINLMWNISHPDKIEDTEYEEFDHIFVASHLHASDLARRLQTSVSVLLQCTDPNVFFPDPNTDIPAETLLFVGNSRKQYREIVRLAVRAKMPVGVYGTHWSMFIPAEYIRGEHIENSVLRQYYGRCQIVLNDHWPSMRDHGFISNRLFDAAAAGAFVISDRAQDSGKIFGDDLVTYGSEDEFRGLVGYYLEQPGERREKAARLRERVLAHHTFAHRAAEIATRIRELDLLKRDPAGLCANQSPVVAHQTEELSSLHPV